MSARRDRTMAQGDDATVTWRCRLVQLVMRRLIKPRLTLAHGVEPFRLTLDRLLIKTQQLKANHIARAARADVT